jgi:general stress protein 26
MIKQILMYIPYGIILIERIYFQTGKNSKKLRNIKKKNNIYFCIDQTSLPYKGVRGKGTAIISEDINKNLPIVEKLMLKYTGSS